MEKPFDPKRGKEIPSSWIWTNLGEICIPPQYGWTTSASNEGNLKLLRTTDITSGVIDWPSVPYCETEPDDIDKYLLHDGDIVISRAGSIGYSILVKNPEKSVFASYLIRFRPYSPVLNKYLSYFLNSSKYWESISEKSLGIAIPNVNASKLKQITIPIAPFPEQHSIVAKIEELFTQLDAAEAALRRAKANLLRYRRSVLQAASSGQLVEQDPDDEPAEILLKRIEEHRRLQILDKRKADFRAQLNLRIQTSSKAYSPQDVLIDLLLETILDEIKPDVVQRVIDVFFATVDNATDDDILKKNYWSWLNTSFDHLRSFQYSSRVINAQMKAWDSKPEKHTNGESGRPIRSLFFGGNYWSSTMLKGLDFQTIKLEGQSYLAEKFLTQPVEREWKQILSQKRKPDLEKLPDLPEGWCWVTTDQLLGFVTSGSRGWAKYYSNSGATFLRIGNLDHDTIDLDLRDLQKVTLPSTTEGLRTRVAENDILVSITADVGMIGLVPGNIGEAYINQHISLARPVDLINPRYLAWFLASQSGQQQFKDLQRGATKMGLGLDDIKSINIPLPPLREQEKIVMEIERQLSIAKSQHGFVDQSLHRISRLRQSILEEAFKGRLVDQNPEDEPASVLLQRIQAEREEREKQQQAAKPKKERKKMTDEKKRKPLVETLHTAGARLTPEELFRRAGFDEQSVDEFYEELRQELQVEINGKVVKPGRIKEERPNQAYIYLAEVKP
jgi:restriction endonuclease S subunit